MQFTLEYGVGQSEPVGAHRRVIHIAFWKWRRRVDTVVGKGHVIPSVVSVWVCGRLGMRYASELVVQTDDIRHYSDEKVECELGLVV